MMSCLIIRSTFLIGIICWYGFHVKPIGGFSLSVFAFKGFFFHCLRVGLLVCFYHWSVISICFRGLSFFCWSALACPTTTPRNLWTNPDIY